MSRGISVAAECALCCLGDARAGTPSKFRIGNLAADRAGAGKESSATALSFAMVAAMGVGNGCARAGRIFSRQTFVNTESNEGCDCRDGGARYEWAGARFVQRDWRSSRAFASRVDRSSE